MILCTLMIWLTLELATGGLWRTDGTENETIPLPGNQKECE